MPGCGQNYFVCVVDIGFSLLCDMDGIRHPGQNREKITCSVMNLLGGVSMKGLEVAILISHYLIYSSHTIIHFDRSISGSLFRIVNPIPHSEPTFLTSNLQKAKQSYTTQHDNLRQL